MATRLTKQVVKYRCWRFTAVFALFASWGNGHPGSGHNTTRPKDERDVNQYIINLICLLFYMHDARAYSRAIFSHILRSIETTTTS